MEEIREEAGANVGRQAARKGSGRCKKWLSPLFPNPEFAILKQNRFLFASGRGGPRDQGSAQRQPGCTNLCPQVLAPSVSPGSFAQQRARREKRKNIEDSSRSCLPSFVVLGRLLVVFTRRGAAVDHFQCNKGAHARFVLLAAAVDVQLSILFFEFLLLLVVVVGVFVLVVAAAAARRWWCRFPSSWAPLTPCQFRAFLGGPQQE